MTTTPAAPENISSPLPPRAVIEGMAQAAIRRVFKDMLDLEMLDDEPLPLADEDAGAIISSVGFIGQITGIIHLYAGLGFAKTITSRMIGIDEAEVDPDEMLNDALAELGNVVVGAVKSELCDRGWQCTLTIPSIMRGHHLRVESIADAPRTVIGFRAGHQRMIVELLVKNLPVPDKPASLKILTIDDSRTVRLTVANAFKRFDCIILEAVNGAEGLEVAAREKPDLILLDYTMPVLDGFEAMTQLVADPILKSIPVVMLTAEGGDKTMMKMARLGVRDYLVKPFKADLFLERIGRIVTLTPRTTPKPINPAPATPQLLNKDF